MWEIALDKPDLPLPEREKDKILVNRILVGDEGAAELFYERYKNLIYGSIHKHAFIAKDEVDDRFQEFFGRLIEDDWRRLRAWRGDSKLSSYLVSILRNFLLDAHRKSRLTVSLDEIAEPATEPFEEIEADLDLSTGRTGLAECVQALSDRDRNLYAKHFVEEMSASDMAAALGMQRNAVYKAIHDAKTRLVRCLQAKFPSYFTSTDI